MTMNNTLHPFVQFLVDKFVNSYQPNPNSKPIPKWRIKSPTGEFITTSSRKTIWRSKWAATAALTRDIKSRTNWSVWSCNGSYPNYWYTLQALSLNNPQMTREEKENFTKQAAGEIKKLFQVVEVDS